MINYVEKEFKNIRYRIVFPKDYVEGKQYPVFFHLHGAGSRGVGFEGFEDSTIVKMIAKGDSALSSGICVFPQCHEDTWYVIFNDLLSLVQHIYDSSFTDKNRFNASGISMGGYAIYQVMQCLPSLFHKAIVCCGGGMYWNSGRLKDIKFRIFHGAKDVAVYPEEATRMYDRLKEALADVTLTIYPECDHNCWDKTYSNYDNLKWIME